MSFHIADLLRDESLLAAVDQVAAGLQACCPEHVTPLIRRWLGNAVDYGEV
jgi:ATP-dependent DNA helicase RecG